MGKDELDGKNIEILRWEIELKVRKQLGDKWNKYSAREKWDIVNSLILQSLKKIEGTQDEPKNV